MSTVSLLTPNFFIQTNLLIVVTIRIKTITAAPTMIIIMAVTKVLIGTQSILFSMSIKVTLTDNCDLTYSA